MDNVDKSFYDSSKKRYEKLSNEQLIMEGINTLLNDVSELIKKSAYFGKKDVITQALQDEIIIRIRNE